MDSTGAASKQCLIRVTLEIALSRPEIKTAFNGYWALAYSQVRLEQMREPAVTAALPYWKFSTAGDGRVREAHAALDGFVAKWNDPIWEKIFPPLDPECRCTVVAILSREAPPNADAAAETRIPEAARKLLNPT